MEIIQRYVIAQSEEDAKAQTVDRGFKSWDEALAAWTRYYSDKGFPIYYVTWIKHVECVWPPM